MEDNFSAWIESMKMALQIKNKIGLVDETLTKPVKNPDEQNQWNQCNILVKTWLLASMSKEIAKSFSHYKDKSHRGRARWPRAETPPICKERSPRAHRGGAKWPLAVTPPRTKKRSPRALRGGAKWPRAVTSPRTKKWSPRALRGGARWPPTETLPRSKRRSPHPAISSRILLF
ncbi:hypothetical protein ACLB2K_063411 [Fragaria x ananassa]